MNRAIKRIFTSVLLLITFGIALYLRLYGMDWALKDNTYSPHPDERHYESCARDMQPEWLTEEEQQLPLQEQIQIFYEKNLKVVPGQSSPGNPGLKPTNYNYGTFPTHLYLLYKAYLTQHTGETGEWHFLTFADPFSWIVLLFVLILGIKIFLAVSRDLRNDPYRLSSDASKQKRKISFLMDERRLTFLFPCLLLPLIGLMLTIYLPQILNDFSRYDPRTSSILIIGRTMTAWAGALTVLVVYLIGRDAFNRATGLIAAFMTAVAMLHVQCSHFATVDILLGFWCTLAVYCFLKISQKPRLIWYILGAIFTGFAVGSKWSAVTLPGILFLAHASATWGDERHGKLERWIQSIWIILLALLLAQFFKAASSMNPPFNQTLAAFRDFYIHHWLILSLALVSLLLLSIIAVVIRRLQQGKDASLFKPIVRIYLPWVWLIIAIPIGLAAFMFAEPMAYFDADQFARDIIYQAGLNATGTIPAVFTQQFSHTTPIFYTLDNLFYPSLDYVTAFFVVAGCIYAFIRIFLYRTNSDLILAAWVIPSFILYSTFASKFPRYMLAILPVMMVLGARLICDLGQLQPTFYTPALGRMSIKWKRMAKRFGIAGGTAALVAGLIYGWAYIGIYDEPHTLVTAGKLLQPKVQEGKRVTQNNWDEGIYGVHVQDQIAIHSDPNAEKDAVNRAQYLANQLAQFDYIVFTSKRGYGTTLHNPEKFPITNQFLKALFAEQLGFRTAKVVTNPPQFLWWEFRVDEEDETARIYDHPKVIIFEKIKPFKTQELKRLILNPPTWVNRITEKEILALRDGYPVFMKHSDHPALKWWFVIQVLGTVAFIFLFPLCSRLPDRGYGISKIVGIALFSWICWFLASTEILTLSRLQSLIVLLLMIMAAAFVWNRYKDSIRLFLREKWPLLLGMETLYLLIWAVFLITRAYHPAAYWGEKPMNYSFINATYRADTFPPEDPWISGHTINYYYYGQAIYSIIGQFADIPPEYAFNLMGTITTALAALGIFTLTYAICRRSWISLLAVYFGVFCSHIYSYACLLKHVYQEPDFHWLDYLRGVLTSLKLIFYAILTYLGMATDAMIEQVKHINFDGVFWPARTDIFYGAVANEFPYWTHLFMDVHAHQLVIPITLAFLTLMLAYFMRPRSEFSSGSLPGFVFFLALLMGSVTCSNTWDLPALLITLLFIVIIKFQRESKWVKPHSSQFQRFSIEGFQDALRFPILPIVSVLILSYLLMLPFHNNFVSRVTGIGFMSEGNTPLSTYLSFWAQFLIPILIGLILFIAIRSDGKISLTRTISFTLLFIVSLIVALQATIYIQSMLEQNPGYFQSWFSIPHEGGPPTDYSVVGLLLPFLIVLFFALWKRDRKPEEFFALFIGFLGLGLSLGIEFFHIKEGWAAPRHRFNTAFKFNIQIWHYYAIFAALCIAYSWKTIQKMSVGKNVKIGGRVALLVLTIPLLFSTLPFTVLGPAMVTLNPGAKSRDARGDIPSLDGLSWLKNESYDAYAGVKWFNRFVEGTPHIVELANESYFDNSRFCSNTGLPAVIGWPHHVGERMHTEEKAPRVRDVNRIYQSNNKQEVLELLGKYQAEYLVFGELEMSKRRGGRNELEPFGPQSLARFEQWGDVFRLTYRLGDTSLFKIDKSLNHAYGIKTEEKVEEAKPPAERTPEQGISMFRGGPGNGNGQFREPRGLTQDATGYFYVADTFNHRIQVFKPNGDFAWKTGEQGAMEGQFKEPNDITIDRKTGNIFVADTWNHRVVLLDPKGSYVGAAAIGFFGPRGIVFHPERQLLFMTDTGNHQIVVLTPQGKLLQRWGKAGGGIEEANFKEPYGITLNPEGKLVITDALNRRVKIYSAEGKLEKLWPIQTSQVEAGGIESRVACSPDGVIYVTDPREPSVHAYTIDGELIEKINQDLSGQKLNRPGGIQVTEKGNVLITDLGLNRILRIK